MTQRKHRGGPSDRSSSRHTRADSQKPSTAFSGKAAFGKGRPDRADPGNPDPRKSGPGKSGPGKSRPAKAGWGKPAHSYRSPEADPPRAGKPGRPRPEQARFGKPGPQSNRTQDRQASRPTLDRHTPDRPLPDRQVPDRKHDRRPARPAETAQKPAPSPVSRQDKPARPGRNQVWIYGLHAVQAALANPQRRHHRLLLSGEAADVLRTISSEINDLKPEIMDRDTIGRFLPAGAVHQGAALLAEPLPAVALEDIIDQAAGSEKSVILILDQVTDPQNVGAILRSAAAFGAAAVVVPDRHAPPETGALVKAASGAVEIVPLVRVINLARAMEDLKAAGFWCAGLEGEAPQTLAAADMTGKVALVLGAEGEGLRRLTRDHCDILVRLPISARMESLNVSAAAAVALYELARKA